jgi:hypothetical protein
MRRVLNRLTLLLRTLVLFILVDLGLWLSSFHCLTKALFSRSRKRPLRPKTPTDLTEIRAVVAAVAAVTRCYYRPRLDCLPRSLCVFYLLRRRGVAVEFLLGVKTFPFMAHAWVEYDHCAIDDAQATVDAFAVMFREA